MATAHLTLLTNTAADVGTALTRVSLAVRLGVCTGPPRESPHSLGVTVAQGKVYSPETHAAELEETAATVAAAKGATPELHAR